MVIGPDYDPDSDDYDSDGESSNMHDGHWYQGYEGEIIPSPDSEFLLGPGYEPNPGRNFFRSRL